MSTAAGMLLPTADDLDSIVSDVVFTLDQLPDRERPMLSGVARAVRARVIVAGASPYVVDVRMTLDGARLLAQAMFDLAPDATSESDVRDAMGELANIVAGNTKSLADLDLTLGLPSTDIVASWAMPRPGLLKAERSWREHDLTVTINPTGERP